MIFLTGTHRSGTSLVAMTMEALDVGFGDHGAFYAADQWNARGYFERRDVMDINSQMITGLSRTRSRAAALMGQVRYLAEPPLAKILERGPAFADQMVSVRDDTGDGAIKDPRLCLTWSAWAQHVDVDSVVVCVRHPFDVADSLRRRQRIPMALGIRFWRYHIRSLKERTPPHMVVVDLESLMDRPSEELNMLIQALGLNLSVEEAVRRLYSVYSPGMAKRSPSHLRPPLVGETSDLWDWLASLRSMPLAGRFE